MARERKGDEYCRQNRGGSLEELQLYLQIHRFPSLLKGRAATSRSDISASFNVEPFR
jgi:hypothetical protein